MDFNLKHIATGWAKSLDIIGTTDEEKELSIQRMKICSECPSAVESSFLKLIGREMKQMGTIKCNECGCPIHEKTLVKNETCKLNNW